MRAIARLSGIAVLVIAAGAALVVSLSGGTDVSKQAPLPTGSTIGALPTPPEANVVPAVYQHVSPSVVSITSVVVARVFGGFVEQPQGTGSGFMIDDRGHIVTNHHVVADANQLQVTFADGITIAARLVGRDPDNDLAVIKIEGPAERIRALAWADSDAVKIGETAIAIGSPFGLDQTVTVGIVSARRQPLEESEAAQGLRLLGGAIQTDAAINPGNSGGPLLNARGEVIGVNTAILSQSGGSVGVGFAIPANVVKRVVPELITRGHYRHPTVGISAIPLTPRLAQALQISVDHGLLVQQVSGAAVQAGLRGGSRVVLLGLVRVAVGGDIVVGIDGRQVGTRNELLAYIENFKKVGDRVTLSVLRDGRSVDLPITLFERPAQ